MLAMFAWMPCWNGEGFAPSLNHMLFLYHLYSYVRDAEGLAAKVALQKPCSVLVL